MTRASPSPSSPGRATGNRVAAGPLDITLVASDAWLLDVVATNLALFDVAWTFGPTRPVELDCRVVDMAIGEAALGTYLEAGLMNVDETPTGMRATTTHGAELIGTFDAGEERWVLRVPAAVVEGGLWPEVEILLTVVYTTGWRRAGWVPLHAAGLTDGQRGVLVCAHSGGGKTTFMMAMVRAGWRALGDDKLLLRSDGKQRLVAALKHMLNVDPAAGAWFPEIGDLHGLPEYSAWTPKRRVALASLWPDSSALSMRPSTIISLERRDGPGVTAEPMDAGATLATLLRQTVIPQNPAQARWIVGEIAACAGGAQGIRLLVGGDAYVEPDSIARIVAELH